MPSKRNRHHPGELLPSVPKWRHRRSVLPSAAVEKESDEGVRKTALPLPAQDRLRTTRSDGFRSCRCQGRIVLGGGMPIDARFTRARPS